MRADAAIIAYALAQDDPINLLDLWMHAQFDEIKALYPDIPDTLLVHEVECQRCVVMRDAIQLQLATMRPFAPVSSGGLGLEYISENLLSTAWKERAERAEAAMRRAIEVQP